MKLGLHFSLDPSLAKKMMIKTIIFSFIHLLICLSRKYQSTHPVLLTVAKLVRMN